VHRLAVACLVSIALSAGTAGAQEIVLPESTAYPERTAWLEPEGFVAHSVIASVGDPALPVQTLVTVTEVRVPLGPIALRTRAGGAVHLFDLDPECGEHVHVGHVYAPELGLDVGVRGDGFRVLFGVSSTVPFAGAEVIEDTTPSRLRGPLPADWTAESDLFLRSFEAGRDFGIVQRDLWVGAAMARGELGLGRHVVVAASARLELSVQPERGLVTTRVLSTLEGGARFWDASLAGVRVRGTAQTLPEGRIVWPVREVMLGVEPFLRLAWTEPTPVGGFLELSTFSELTSPLRTVTVRATMGALF